MGRDRAIEFTTVGGAFQVVETQGGRFVIINTQTLQTVPGHYSKYSEAVTKAMELERGEDIGIEEYGAGGGGVGGWGRLPSYVGAEYEAQKIRPEIRARLRAKSIPESWRSVGLDVPEIEATRIETFMKSSLPEEGYSGEYVESDTWSEYEKERARAELGAMQKASEESRVSRNLEEWRQKSAIAARDALTHLNTARMRYQDMVTKEKAQTAAIKEAEVLWRNAEAQRKIAEEESVSRLASGQPLTPYEMAKVNAAISNEEQSRVKYEKQKAEELRSIGNIQASLSAEAQALRNEIARLTDEKARRTLEKDLESLQNEINKMRRVRDAEEEPGIEFGGGVYPGSYTPPSGYSPMPSMRSVRTEGPVPITPVIESPISKKKRGNRKL